MGIYQASDRKKKKLQKELPKYNQKTVITGDNLPTSKMEKEIIEAQKRALIIEVMKDIINLKQGDLNQQLKMYFLHTNLYLKKLKNENNKGLMALIGTYGDAEEIVKKYEDDEGYTEEMQKQRLLEILEKQAQREKD